MDEKDNSFIMLFEPNCCAFGRHETFPLRYSWLTKGFQALCDDPHVFESEDATVRLGVGKNMVNAIRYWLQAARLVERVDGRYERTMPGMHVFDDNEGYDPYLEDEATIWLIHWLIATNAQLATAWFWFFNQFHKPEFAAQELATALADFAKGKVNGRTSAKTIKQDASVLLRMYSRTKSSAGTSIEDVLDSPLALPGLIQPNSSDKHFHSPPQRRDVPVSIIGFAVIDLCNAINVAQISIEQLMYGDRGSPALGAVFRLTEGALLAKLELLVRAEPTVFEKGTALPVMGNHEFNAIAWATPAPETGDGLRPHSDKNYRQHQAFLDAYDDDPDAYRKAIKWFRTLPLWLELEGLRVIHACRNPRWIARVSAVASPGQRLTDDLLVQASSKGAPGSTRRSKPCSRARRSPWARGTSTTTRKAPRVTTSGRAGDHLPRRLHGGRHPRSPTSPRMRSPETTWSNTVSTSAPCFSAITGSKDLRNRWHRTLPASTTASPGRVGHLVAYRWSGEQQLDAGNFVIQQDAGRQGF